MRKRDHSSASKTKVGWGILGPGRIARKFARDLALTPGARLAAVGSRDPQRASAFCSEFGGAPVSDYAALVAHPDVDVVYVATPHTLHAEHSRLGIDAGKAVLCEKPLTMDLASARELIDHAKASGVFFMEAMWMACNPTIRTVQSLLASGEYGTPRQVTADFGFVVNAEPSDRLLDPRLGASTLFDLGIYPLTFAHLFLGPATELTGVAHHAEDGVDMNLAVAGKYAHGAVAALSASMTAHTPGTASIATDIGRFDFDRGFHKAQQARWTSYWEPGGATEDIDPSTEPNGEGLIGVGYGNQALEVQRCLHAGRCESPVIPWSQTLELIQALEELRKLMLPG